MSFIRQMSRNHWLILGLQMLLLCFLLLHLKWPLQYVENAGGDEPSYRLFDFTSLHGMLGGHRTMGLPLILKSWQVVFPSFCLWPYFQMLCYFMSVLFFYWSMRRFGFRGSLSLVFASCLIWERSVFGFFGFVLTESFAATFLNLSLGAMLLSVISPNWKHYLLFAIFTFLLYQIRPNFAIIPVLVPLWMFIVPRLFSEKVSPCRAKRLALNFFLLGTIPLVTFCFLRLAVVGQFGLVSLNGVLLSGHATHYLNETNVDRLSSESLALGKEILYRKRSFSPPCNSTPYSYRGLSLERSFEDQAVCFGPNVMMSWLVAIKQKLGKEPFLERQKNIEAWKHVDTLSAFYSIYNADVDRSLMRFSVEVLQLEWRRYVRWIISGFFGGIKAFVSDRWTLFVMLFVVTALTKSRILAITTISNKEIRQLNCEVLFLSLVGATIFVIGLIPLIVLNYPFPRLFNLIAMYLVPSLVAWAITPFGLVGIKSKKKPC